MSKAAIRQLTDAEQKMLEQAENTSESILKNINYSITDTFENNKTIQDALLKPYSPILSLQDAANSKPRLRISPVFCNAGTVPERPGTLVSKSLVVLL